MEENKEKKKGDGQTQSTEVASATQTKEKVNAMKKSKQRTLVQQAGPGFGDRHGQGDLLHNSHKPNDGNNRDN